MTKKTPDLFESDQNESNSPVQENEATQQQSITFTAGQTLANARTAAGLALEDLAEELRVPLKVLEGIEQDDWPENLPETFIRGYIRAYAKRVNVPESDVLSTIDSTAASQPTSTQMHSFSKRSKRKKIEKRLVLVTWILGLALILAFAIWFFQSYNASQAAPVADTKSSDSLTLPVPATDVMSEIEVPVVHSEILTKQVTPLEDTSDKEQTQTTNTENKASNELPLVVTSDVQQDTSSDDNSAQPTMQLSDEQLKLVAQGGDSDDENYMVVEFKFENDCWVEVYDAYNERIAIGNKPAGYLMTLNAQGPFNVLLGNPAGVSIWVNGQPYDLSDMPTNRVARFEIDEQL